MGNTQKVKRSIALDVDIYLKLEDLRARYRPIPSFSEIVNKVLRKGLECLEEAK